MAPAPPEPRPGRSTDDLLTIALRRGRRLRRRRRLTAGGVGALALAGLVPATVAVLDTDTDTEVVLVAREGEGAAASLTPGTDTTTTVQVSPDPWFTFAVLHPNAREPIQFTDATNGPVTSWQWTFGDGATSTAQNPIHTFVMPGSYEVQLTVTGPSGSATATRTVDALPAGETPPDVIGIDADADGQGVVPAVTGLLADSAQTRIAQAGLTTIVTFQELPVGSADIGRVISQSPPAGTMMATHEVTIVVGREGG